MRIVHAPQTHAIPPLTSIYFLPFYLLIFSTCIGLVELNFVFGGINGVKAQPDVIRFPRIRKRADHVPFRYIISVRYQHKCIQADIETGGMTIFSGNPYLKFNIIFIHSYICDPEFLCRHHRFVISVKNGLSDSI